MSATAAVAFAAAASNVRIALSHIRAAGTTPDNGPLGTVVTDLERIAGVLATRAEREASPAPVADQPKASTKPLNPAPAAKVADPVPTEADFDAAARRARPDWLGMSDDGRAWNVAAWKASGLTPAAYWALPLAKRLELAEKGKAAPAPIPATPHTLGTAVDGRDAVSKRVNRLTWNELRAECKGRGINAKGSLIVLQGRLVDQIMNPAPVPAPKAKPTAPAKGTAWIADGKGGFTPATAEQLAEILDGMTAPPAKLAA
jgi:hypothetical protein